MTSVQQRVSQFKRLFSKPLDIDLVFATIAEMNAYLVAPTVAYAGMIAACTEEGYEGRVFVLNNDKDEWLEQYSANYQILLPDVDSVNVGDTFTHKESMKEFRLVEIDSVRGWVETTPPTFEYGEGITGPIGSATSPKALKLAMI